MDRPGPASGITFSQWWIVVFPVAILEILVCVLSHHLRYLLYDVNPPEGFNLRRDVYIRMASLVKTLTKDGDDWVLVLPPWGRLYHWQSPDIYQLRIPWGEFFSLTSLQVNVPVIEYEEFIAGKLLVTQTHTQDFGLFFFPVNLTVLFRITTNLISSGLSTLKPNFLSLLVLRFVCRERRPVYRSGFGTAELCWRLDRWEMGGKSRWTALHW